MDIHLYWHDSTTLTHITAQLNRMEHLMTDINNDQAKLDSGQGSAKDLQALQHEITSLAARQSALEDVELEVMERLERRAHQSTAETGPEPR